MVGPGRANGDPSADFSASDQGILHDIEREEGQAGEVVGTQVFQAAQAMFDPAMAVVADAGTAVGIGDGFRFSPEEADRQIAQCNALINDFDRDNRDIRTIRGAQAPAPDANGSELHVQAVRRFGSDLHERNKSQVQFLKSWVRKLTTAQQAYLNRDHAVRETWHRIGKRPGG